MLQFIWVRKSIPYNYVYAFTSQPNSFHMMHITVHVMHDNIRKLSSYVKTTEQYTDKSCQ